MDGLLVDTERLERRVWLAAAEEHGMQLSDDRFASFVGHAADECDRMLASYYGDAFDVPAFRAACHRRMRVIVQHEGVPLRQGAQEWLHFVVAQRIPLALATSSAPDLVGERLGGLRSLFAAVVTRADVARGKPHPDIYLEVAERLCVHPADALALEDSPTGARAAIAAGMPVLMVPDLVAPPPDLVGALVGVFDSLHDVRSAAAALWGDPVTRARRPAPARRSS